MPKQYPVITQKAADDHYQNIVAQHASILDGYANQSAKVANFNANKQAELQQQQTQKSQLDNARMVANTQAQKNAMDFAQKQSEIDIKRASLSMK